MGRNASNFPVHPPVGSAERSSAALDAGRQLAYQAPGGAEPERVMNEEEVLAEFRAAGALLEGHFVLSSGRHSDRYLQCARVLMDPMRASRLATALAGTIPRDLRSQIGLVVSPAMGGVIIGHEMGRALGVEAVFVERPSGRFELRRGFAIEPGQKVLLVEDVVTTGLSSREAIAAVEEAGGEVIAAAALIDRSGGSADLGRPFFTLATLTVPTYAADELPPELAAIPAEKPGSRKAV
jgi:orotate phosphoribosyltransferase